MTEIEIIFKQRVDNLQEIVSKEKHYNLLLTQNLLLMNNITMTIEDFKALVNAQEDCELWLYSTLGKKFNHIINQGLQAEWLVLNGEYVKVAY